MSHFFLAHFLQNHRRLACREAGVAVCFEESVRLNPQSSSKWVETAGHFRYKGRIAAARKAASLLGISVTAARLILDQLVKVRILDPQYVRRAGKHCVSRPFLLFWGLRQGIVGVS